MRISTYQCCQGLVLLTLTCLAGCGGCLPDGSEKLSREEIQKRAQERRESLQLSEFLALPSDSDAKILHAKPGHWLESQQQFKSNREDLQVLAVGSVTRGAELALISGTDFSNEYTRRTSLPKGQTKSVDLQFFTPLAGKVEDPLDFSVVASNRLSFQTQLLTWPLLTPILQSPSVKPANELNEHEYQLVVLSPQSLGYEYITSSDAILWRGDALAVEDRIRSYVVTLVKPVEGKYAFPHSMLTMTSIAVLVWDDVVVDDLTSDQQNAIIDWVHWGGQLIVSGPSSWSRLQNSFLSPHLPALSAESVELDSQAFEPLSATWVTSDAAAPGQREPLEVIGAKIGGLKFSLREAGSWLPGSGELVAESQVGRGRIVLTAFPLREPRIYGWKYFSSFLSTGLLRRPPRTVVRDLESQSSYQAWVNPWRGLERDPRLHSNFRILSRDLPLSEKLAEPEPPPQTQGFPDYAFRNLPPPRPTPEEEEAARPKPRPVSLFNAPGEGDSNQIEAQRWGSGGAAWNDYSGFSYEALAALKAAAGIELPSRSTILYLLAGYLTCLVPLNWLVFRLIGRLELAWVAAPLLALLGVAVVTRVARLDIGFARRTTEISLLELYGNYPRGHLTQYLALYTSLSTNYAIDFPENGSVALPMGDVTRTRRRASAEVRNLRTNYGRSEGVVLEPMTVYSNSTEMLHAEQMIGLPGGLNLGQSTDSQLAVKNDTGLNLKSGLILRCQAPGLIQWSPVGDLPAGQVAKLNFESVDYARLWEVWNDAIGTQMDMPDSSQADALDSLWIGGLLRELVSKTPLVEGQTRLIAYTDDRPGDLAVVPKEDQFDGRCVVVVHLTPGVPSNVRPDAVILGLPASGEFLPSQPVEIDNAGDPTSPTVPAGPTTDAVGADQE